MALKNEQPLNVGAPRTAHTSLLPNKLKMKVKPMAQHSQPMRLPARRVMITAPTSRRPGREPRL
jgi:hypothetical protein